MLAHIPKKTINNTLLLYFVLFLDFVKFVSFQIWPADVSAHFREISTGAPETNRENVPAAVVCAPNWSEEKSGF